MVNGLVRGSGRRWSGGGLISGGQVGCGQGSPRIRSSACVNRGDAIFEV